MSRASLASALLTSFLMHLTGLTALSLVWESLPRSPSLPTLIPAELVVIAPPPSLAEPVTLPALEPISLPRMVEKADLTRVDLPPPPAPQPVAPPKLEPITPPRIVEKTDFMRADFRPELPPSKKPSPAKNPALPHPSAFPPGPPASSKMTKLEKPKPGPPIPLPDENPMTSGGNVLGPPSPMQAEEQPLRPVEGGEAGAGSLFEQGDVAVVPGPGVGGGGGGPGKARLGLGGDGGGTTVGGIRPGSGGEGPGGGVGSATRPLGGYQVKPRYPESARRQGSQGATVLRFEVRPDGTVGEILVERSAGHPDLDRAAVEAVKQWRFKPARRGKQPIAVWATLPVRFELK